MSGILRTIRVCSKQGGTHAGRLCNFLLLALLAFWLWPTAQKLWVVFDEWHFHPPALPAINPIWLHGWAIASLGPFDAVVGAVFYPHVIRQIRWPGECCAVPVGAGLLAKAASQAAQKQLAYSSLLLPRNLNKSRRCFLLGLPSVLTPSAPALRMAAAASRLAILASVSA